MSGGWNTIESDAGVFTYLVENLGVKDVQFEELISLDPDFLKQQSPVYGVIFLFKYPTGEKPSSTPQDGEFDYSANEKAFFAAQTIQNACGTQALLSVLLNKDTEIDIGENLKEFKEFTAAFPSDLRGEALSNSELIREVHNSFARSSPFISEDQRVAGEDDDVYHFVAYTCTNDTLYELDGLQPAPISHGPCSCSSPNNSEFCEKVIPILQRRIERYPAGEIRFNLLAMVRDKRIKAREIGDWETLEREEERRRGWRWENALRRHNFLGFVGEVLKEVVKSKLENGEGEYERWVKAAVEETRKREEESRAKRRRKGAKGEDEMDVEV